MASFARNCPRCYGEGASGCPGCHGTGRVSKPVTVTVKIATDNREPRDFRMSISEMGSITFTEKGHKKGVMTSVQSAFNRALVESAKVDAKPKRHRISRGLLAIGRRKL